MNLSFFSFKKTHTRLLKIENFLYWKNSESAPFSFLWCFQIDFEILFPFPICHFVSYSSESPFSFPPLRSVFSAAFWISFNVPKCSKDPGHFPFWGNWNWKVLSNHSDLMRFKNYFKLLLTLYFFLVFSFVSLSLFLSWPFPDTPNSEYKNIKLQNSNRFVTNEWLQSLQCHVPCSVNIEKENVSKNVISFPF